MSAAWNALASRLAKVERLAQTIAADAAKLPDGMISVLMFGIAVHLGDFPTPRHPQGMLQCDNVATALDRGLGFPDAAERYLTAPVRDDEWLRRFADAAGALSLRIGLDTPNPSMVAETTLVAFVRMLTDIDAMRASWGDPLGMPRSRPWGDVGDDMDAWIRASHLSPEAVRAKARAEPRL